METPNKFNRLEGWTEAPLTAKQSQERCVKELTILANCPIFLVQSKNYTPTLIFLESKVEIYSPVLQSGDPGRTGRQATQNQAAVGGR